MSKPTPTNPHHFIIAWHRRHEPDKPIRWTGKPLTRTAAAKYVRNHPSCKEDNEVLYARIWNYTTHPLEIE